MSHIFQRSPNDCGVAALAMFMGADYDDVVRKIRKDVPAHDACQTGLHATWMLQVILNEGDFAVITVQRTAHLPAILLVQAFSNQLLGHAVYWDGERVWDPSPGQEVTEAWLAKHEYAAIQRVRDLAESLGSRDRHKVRDAFAPAEAPLCFPREIAA